MRIAEPRKNQLNEFLSQYGFDTISGTELTSEIANQAKNNGTTPLFVAAQNGHVKIVQELIEAKADLDKAVANGITPLWIAVQNGHVKIVEELIEAEADLNKARIDNGITPLFMAAQEGHFEIVQKLIEAKADFDKATANGITPLFMAAQEGHVKIVKELIKAKVDIDKPMSLGITPLYIAAQNGHFEIVQKLIEAKVDVDKAKNNGQTPLFIAAKYGHLKIVQQLIEAKANLDIARTDNGQTALFIAAGYGHLKIVQQLIEAKADLDIARTDNGQTALFIAAWQGHLETARLLLLAQKLSSGSDLSFSLPPGININPAIREILDCDSGIFINLQNNLHLISQVNKLESPPDKHSSMADEEETAKAIKLPTLANQANTTQIILKALYDKFEQAENLEDFLREFTEIITIKELNRFNLNNPESLSALLSLSKSTNFRSEVAELSPGIYQEIAEYTGAFSDAQREILLTDHLNEQIELIIQRQRETIARPQSHLERLLAEREREDTGHNRS